MFTVFTLATVACADTIHVCSGESIQIAIDGPVGGEEVTVHPGTYVERIDLLGRRQKWALPALRVPAR